MIAALLCYMNASTDPRLEEEREHYKLFWKTYFSGCNFMTDQRKDSNISPSIPGRCVSDESRCHDMHIIRFKSQLHKGEYIYFIM